MDMTKKMAGCAIGALCACTMLAGCGGSAAEEETTAVPSADVPELAVANGWADVQADYAALDSQAQQKVDGITSANVRDEALACVDTIIANAPGIMEAAQNGGEITPDVESACKEVYTAAFVLDALGDESAQDVSLYLKDISVDARYLIEDLYNGFPTDAVSKKSECFANRDRIMSFGDDEWETYAATV